MQLVCQLREKDEADSGADHVMFLEVGSKTEDTRLALITLSVSLKNCYLEKIWKNQIGLSDTSW